jgi:hypothetical protein
MINVRGEELLRAKWPFFLFSSPANEETLKCLDEPGEYIPTKDLAVNSAYFANQKMPPGCDCRKTGDADSECYIFECTCICDLTAGTHTAQLYRFMFVPP